MPVASELRLKAGVIGHTADIVLQLCYPERPCAHSVPGGLARAKRQEQVLMPPEGVGFTHPRSVTLKARSRWWLITAKEIGGVGYQSGKQRRIMWG